MADSRIKLIHREGTRGGAPVCRNLGVHYATSDYIVFLDSDDMVDKNFISKRKEIIERFFDNDAWIFPVQVFYNTPGDSKLLWNVFNENNDLDRFLNADPPWHTSSPVWKKNSFLNTGGFDEELLCWQDWEIHLRALILGIKYEKIKQKPDIFYRMHLGDAIRKKNTSYESLLSRFEAVQKCYHLIKTKQALSKKRKYYFAKLLMNILIFLLKIKPHEKAVIIDFIKKENILPGFELKIWMFRINHNFKISNIIIDKIIYWKYSNHFLDTKTDYLNTEIKE
jgi:GT2 family glycosyltransferase